MRSLDFKLASFEGPLDLLLHLIHKAKIDLQDIFVSHITEQYLEYMAGIEEVDMDRASDFLNMAALLVYIKSRSLLPVKRDPEEDDEDYVDPETQLIERLRAYQKFKEASSRLDEMAKEAVDVFYKLPDELFDGEQELVLVDADADLLYKAFLEILKKRREPAGEITPVVKISHDSFSIRRQKKKIISLLRERGSIIFDELFGSVASRMELAVTFFALLELWHVSEICVKQKSFLNKITITYNADKAGGI